MVVGSLTVLATTGIRSLSTKCVSEDDLGKAQSLISIADAIAISASAQIYNKGFYAYTRETFGQAFFLVGIGLYSFSLSISM